MLCKNKESKQTAIFFLKKQEIFITINKHNLYLNSLVERICGAVNQKNRNRTHQEQIRLRLPKKNSGELFAIAERLMGGSRMKVVCADGKGRLARIPGRMKRRARVRAGDLLIVVPWDIQDDKADVIYRYTKTQSRILSRRKLLPENLDVF
jgi:translation initiation factor 1A